MTTMQTGTGFFTGQGGLRIFYRSWVPAQPKGSAILAHGLNEHSGRYEHVARYLVEHANLAVYALDHRGHGQSEGTRSYVDRFSDFLADLGQFVQQVTGMHSAKPLLIGHSMGGLISFRYALQHPDAIRGLVLSSPWFHTKAKTNPVQKALAPLVARLAPKIKIRAAVKPEHVCRNPATVKAYASDPLVSAGITPRLFVECETAQVECRARASACTLPILVLQAGEDLLADAAVARELYDSLPGPTKHFNLYPGLYHEIFNELEYEQILGDMLTWLREQELV